MLNKGILGHIDQLGNDINWYIRKKQALRSRYEIHSPKLLDRVSWWKKQNVIVFDKKKIILICTLYSKFV